MKRIALAVALLTPVAAMALDYSPVSNEYADGPFSTDTSAAIDVLTNLGAIGGYPDGTFRPATSVNRAEFLKMMFMSYPSPQAGDRVNNDCFPDVHSPDWFADYVCTAKQRQILHGYPDGLFHPERTVQYVEALKMLVNLYNIPVPLPPENERWAWYRGYLLAAQSAGTTLSDSTPLDAPLTRGSVARLIAAFRAYSDGELQLYREAERGETPAQSASSSSSSMTSSVSSSSSSTSSSPASSESSISSASSSSLAALPAAISHFLLAGQLTPMMADGTISATGEDLTVRTAEVELRDPTESIASLLLVNSAGETLVELHPRGTLNDDEKRTWEGDAGALAWYSIQAGTSARVGLRAVMKEAGREDTSGDTLEILRWLVGTRGSVSNSIRSVSPANASLPRHQTAVAAVTGLRNSLASSMTVSAGKERLIGAYTLTGTGTANSILRLRELSFAVERSNVQLSRPRIGGNSSFLQEDCGTSQTDATLTITCTVFPDGYDEWSDHIDLSIVADLALIDPSLPGTVRLVPLGRGAIGQNGAVRFDDGSTNFSWIESSSPLESGPNVTITQ